MNTCLSGQDLSVIKKNKKLKPFEASMLLAQDKELLLRYRIDIFDITGEQLAKYFACVLGIQGFDEIDFDYLVVSATIELREDDTDRERIDLKHFLVDARLVLNEMKEISFAQLKNWASVLLGESTPNNDFQKIQDHLDNVFLEWIDEEQESEQRIIDKGIRRLAEKGVSVTPFEFNRWFVFALEHRTYSSLVNKPAKGGPPPEMLWGAVPVYEPVFDSIDNALADDDDFGILARRA